MAGAGGATAPGISAGQRTCTCGSATNAYGACSDISAGLPSLELWRPQRDVQTPRGHTDSPGGQAHAAPNQVCQASAQAPSRQSPQEEEEEVSLNAVMGVLQAKLNGWQTPAMESANPPIAPIECFIAPPQVVINAMEG